MNDLSIIITADFIPSHPSITQIRTVIESLEFLKIHKDTKIILAHDSIRDNLKQVLKKCDINYNKYFQNLQDYCDNHSLYKNIKITCVEKWGHLIPSIKNAMQFVETEFVFILQHDIAFYRPIDNFYELINVIKNNSDVKCIKFIRNKNLPIGWDGGDTPDKYKKDIFMEAFKEYNFNNIKLCKTLCFGDQNHLTTKKYYEDIIFKDCFLTGSMEHCLLKKNVDNPERYGTYNYGAYGEEASTKDIDGCRFFDPDFVFDYDYAKDIHPELKKISDSIIEKKLPRHGKILKQACAEIYGNIDFINPDFDLEFYSNLVNAKFNSIGHAFRHWMANKKVYKYINGKLEKI